MKFLHIIPPSRRMMDTYIRMLRENYTEDEHHFYFINPCPESEESLFEYGNVQQMSGNNKKEKMIHLKSALDSADLVFWHGLIYPGRFMLFLSAYPKFLKKSIWIIWGIDLYNWKRPENSLRNIIINKLNHYCRCHMKAVIALVEPDKTYYQQNFNSKIPCYVTPYPISKESFDAMDKYRNWKARENKITYIQVAHNAHTFNRHIEILESLLPYADENMTLFLPMSYGNDWHTSSPQYGKNVQQFAYENFPDKVHIMYKLMPQLKYTEFLWNMDISIFNAARQNALGNILKLLYMGNKVYLTPDGPLYKFFKDKNFEIYNTKDVGKISYEEFIKPSQNINAIKWIRETYHPDYAKYTWKTCFEKLCGQTLTFKTNDPPMTPVDEGQVFLHTMQKSNYFDVVRYQKWKININNIPDLTIIGADLFGLRIFQWCKEINQKKFQWIIHGFLDENIKTLHGIVQHFDVIGTWKEWEKTDNNKIVFAIELPFERKKAVDFFCNYYDCNVDNTENDILPVEELIHPTTSISSFSTRGQGCLIGPLSVIDVYAEIGNFVYINQSYIGSNSKIGNFCNIGVNCYIGKNVIIDDGITIPDSTVIPDGSHIKNKGILL